MADKRGKGVNQRGIFQWFTLLGILERFFGILACIMPSLIYWTAINPKNTCRPVKGSLHRKRGVIIGFLNEASPQTKDNTQRVWSFTKPKKIKNTDYYKANTFGFYPLNRKEVLEFKEQSKAGDLCDFLRQIRMKNPRKHLIIILDNARSHNARQTRAFSQPLDISLIFLPPYPQT